MTKIRPIQKTSPKKCKSGACKSPQAGKGDAPRNISIQFRKNYDGINWHKNKQ